MIARSTSIRCRRDSAGPGFQARLVVLLVWLNTLVTPISIAAQDSSAAGNSNWQFSIKAGFGYFNFRDSLFIDIEPDPPGNLSDDWLEFYVKPQLAWSAKTATGEWFGQANWVYAKTSDDGAEVAGGGASSAEIDELFVGWRYFSTNKSQVEIVAGNYPYTLAHGFLVSDGATNGGSRGAYWSGPRSAWSPGGRIMLSRGGHSGEVFYLERNEPDDADSNIEITALNYQYTSSDERWNFGASYLRFQANANAPQLDGADIWNLRLYTTPFALPLTVEAEWAGQDNGELLDANAWYLRAFWQWEDRTWQPTLYYRYTKFGGDKPDTPSNEHYDPLFAGVYDWGDWFQGEIAGNYLLSNSNLRSHGLRLHAIPKESVGTGLAFYDFSLDEPGSFAGGVNSSDVGWEVNWYMDWAISPMLTMTFVLATASPGRAIEEAYQRSQDFNYGMVYMTFGYQ